MTTPQAVKVHRLADNASAINMAWEHAGLISNHALKNPPRKLSRWKKGYCAFCEKRVTYLAISKSTDSSRHL
jgi:hypothetical protein